MALVFVTDRETSWNTAGWFGELSILEDPRTLGRVCAGARSPERRALSAAAAVAALEVMRRGSGQGHVRRWKRDAFSVCPTCRSCSLGAGGAGAGHRGPSLQT